MSLFYRAQLILVVLGLAGVEAPLLANTDLGPGVVNAAAPPYNAIASGGDCSDITAPANIFNDATAAIQAALNDVGAGGGGIVFLPTGIYCVDSHLTIPAFTTLKGVFQAPPKGNSTSDLATKGTVLIASESKGNANGTPFITLAGYSATVDGLTIYYPYQTSPKIGWTPAAYPYTIRGGIDTNIQNIMLLNSYQGIDLFTNASARHNVKGVYGQPLFRGIVVNQSHDIGRISDIHFWPFWSLDTNVRNWVQNNGISLIFGSADFEIAHEVFSFGYHVGISFQNMGDGGTSGEMSNMNFDSVGIGIDLYATYAAPIAAAVQFNNLIIASASSALPRIGIWNHSNNNNANLTVVNADFFGPMKQAILWEQNGLLMVSNARFQAAEVGTPVISITKGDAMIQNSAFQGASASIVDVQTASTAGRIVIVGNIKYGGTFAINNTQYTVANNQL